MKLKIEKPGDSTCSCGSWLNHWNAFSSQTMSALCPVLMCVEKNEVGAHVQKEGADKTLYILPLCQRHAAQAGEIITVNDYLPLVTTNVTETCAKEKSTAQPASQTSSV
jgi:hypothetical protein